MIANMSPVPDTGTSQTAPSLQKSLGKDDFLQLLVAQLSAQDPLNPMEAQDFSAQLAQFSSLEQITNFNDTLKELKVSQDAMSNSSMINLIGKTVDVPGNSFELQDGGEVNLSYILPEGSQAESVFVDVFDATGIPVTTLNGGTDAGTNLVTWGGVGGDGSASPEGTYTFKVRALDGDGKPISTELFTTGPVTDVLFENGIAYAVVNGQKIEAGNITRVSSL
jgi:flagellar basal-body rod modification protein FlgD